mmetsp:Transcript_15586/g.22606  ORF Transcript_15586/g.22606 Transcript_15586/m.22606 type:complete len:134 (+) Transcript_15586:918-1319(+)
MANDTYTQIMYCTYTCNCSATIFLSNDCTPLAIFQPVKCDHFNSKNIARLSESMYDLETICGFKCDPTLSEDASCPEPTKKSNIKNHYGPVPLEDGDRKKVLRNSYTSCRCLAVSLPHASYSKGIYINSILFC